MKIFYRVIEHCQESFYIHEASGFYDLKANYELEALLEQCADNYWINHNGYESSWPLTFAIYREENGPEIARATIDMEAEPRFYATMVNYNVEPATAD